MSFSLQTIKMPWGDQLPVSGYNPAEFKHQHVIAEIYRSYGVKALFKGKSLRKFGRTNNADDGVKTTIATFGSNESNEIYSTSNDIDAVSSSSSSDTGQLRVEGHTIDSNGDLTFNVQFITLNGQTPVTLPTPLARCNRLAVKDGTFISPAVDLVGDIYAFKSDGVTVTSGVPQTAATIKCKINAGRNQSEKGATSISSNDFWYIEQYQVGATRDNGRTVDFDSDIEISTIGGVFKPTGLELQFSTSSDPNLLVDLNPGIIVPSNSDIRQVITSGTDNSIATGFMNGPLLTTNWSYDEANNSIVL